MYYPMYFDPTYMLVLIGVVICLAASAKMRSTFSRYSRIRNHSGMTGREAAEQVLHRAGIYDVRVEHVSGNLTDHYDPRSKVLRLSDATYGSASVAAVGVAAHECGHAVQDKESYAPLRIRTALVPEANLGCRLGIPLVILGLILGLNSTLAMIGVWIFAVSVLFQIVTLPVEYNASGRALRMLEDYHILGGQETEMARKVLGAAALTYVAAAASSVLQLLRLWILAGGNRRDD